MIILGFPSTSSHTVNVGLPTNPSISIHRHYPWCARQLNAHGDSTHNSHHHFWCWRVRCDIKSVSMCGSFFDPTLTLAATQHATLTTHWRYDCLGTPSTIQLRNMGLPINPSISIHRHYPWCARQLNTHGDSTHNSRCHTGQWWLDLFSMSAS